VKVFGPDRDDLPGLRQGDGLIGEDKTQPAQSQFSVDEAAGLRLIVVMLQSPVRAVIDASGSPYEISEEIPPVDGAGGALTATNAREPNANLVRPGMSVETAVTVLSRANSSPVKRAARIGCGWVPSTLWQCLHRD
jgi:hypothetical protein